MKTFLLGLIVGILLLPATALVYIRRGDVPVETSAPPLPMEKTVTRMALKARIAKEAPKDSPVAPSEANLVAGAVVYRDYCASCHGLPEKPKSAEAKGMFPPPPQLLAGKGVTDDPVGETYWVAANGIRLTGMPAFRGSLSEDQLWQVSQMLAHADKLPQKGKDLLAQPAAQ